VSPQGFRGSDPDPLNAWKVLTLGDSTTFGWGVAQNETYSALLEADLQRALDPAGTAGGGVQVLNGGVIGFTIRQGLERYRAVAAAWRPDVVVAAFGAINEHYPTTDLADVDKLVWVRERASFLWQVERCLRNEVRLVSWLARWQDERQGGRDAQFGAFVQREQEKRLALQAYDELADYPRRVSAADFQLCLRELDTAVRRDGGRLVLVRVPRRRVVEETHPQVLDYDAELTAFLETSDVACVDARAELRARIAAGSAEAELFVDSVHPGAVGHRLIADRLLPEVLALLPPPAGR
jgi:lysophospholipase L1-like esterase